MESELSPLAFAKGDVSEQWSGEAVIILFTPLSMEVAFVFAVSTEFGVPLREGLVPVAVEEEASDTSRK